MRVFFTQWRKIIEKNDAIQHERKTAQFSTVLFLVYVVSERDGKLLLEKNVPTP